ncbi:MAG: hypothetical protein ACRCX8_08670 [Sarcina sp.]
MRRLVLAMSLYTLTFLYINENNVPSITETNSEFKGELKREINLEYEPLNRVINRAKKVKKERLEKERKEKEILRLKQLEEQKRKERERRFIDVEVSFYCSCEICCNEYATLNPGITASGTKAKFGTIAAPKELKFGTRMKIRSFGDKIFNVEDRGGYIKKVNGVYRLDVYVNSHAEAMRRGRYRDKAEIIK